MLVFVSDGSNSLDLSLSGTDGVDYTGNLTYGSGTFATDAGATVNAYCVANQTADVDGDIVVTGLTENSTYYVYLYAYLEIAGNSDNDSISAEVSGGSQAAILDPISGVIVVGGDGQLEVSWTNPTSAQGTYWDEVVIVARSATAVESIVSATTLDNLIDGTTLSSNLDWSARSNTNDVYDQTLNLVGSDNTNYVVYTGTGTSATITGLSNSTDYHIRLFTYYTEDDSDENWATGVDESGTPVVTPNAWINAFHYDNFGTDQDEFVEIVIENAASYDLSDFRVDIYNGTSKQTKDSATVDGFNVGSSECGFVFYSNDYAPNTLENGAPDGLCLSWQGTVLEFLSYEGTFTASDGPASGLTSTDIGINQSSSGTPVGYALQRTGNGDEAADFTWIDTTSTQDSINIGQSFGDLFYTSGSGWSPSAPTASSSSDIVYIASGSTTTTGDIHVQKLCVQDGASYTVQAGHVVEVETDVHNNGTFTIENEASLVQNNVSDQNEGTGTFSVTRNSGTVTDNTRYNYWSSPVVGELINDVFPNSNTGDFYQYNNWPWVSANSVTMVAGVGYAGTSDTAASFPASFDRTFTGTGINNGNVTVTGLGTDYNDWVLLGNPYPCGLNIAEFTRDNGNISSSYWYWNHNTAGSKPDSTQDYAMYVAGTGGTAANSGGAIPDSIVASCQGFMAQLTGGSSVTFDNSQRTTLANDGFYKTQQPTKDRRNLIWLGLLNDQLRSNQILVGFVPGATNGYDTKYDGVKLKGESALAFYSEVDSQQLAIQALQKLAIDETRSIPLGVDARQTGTYTIRLDSLFNVPSGYVIQLHDRDSGIHVNLRDTLYTFPVTTPGILQDRFYLEVRNEIPQTGGSGSDHGGVGQAPITGVSELNADVANVYVSGEYLVVESEQTARSLTLYDIQGRAVLQAIPAQSNQRWLVNQLPPGVYITRVQVASGKTVVKRVAVP